MRTEADLYLSHEHLNHRALFERILNGDYAAFNELRSALIRHVRLEEKFLFAPALHTPELEEAVRIAWEEHNLLMEILQKIDEKEPGSVSWLAKVRLLEKLHEVHIENEETILFPLLGAFFSGDSLGEMGEMMKATRRDQTPDQILYPKVPGSHQIN